MIARQLSCVSSGRWAVSESIASDLAATVPARTCRLTVAREVARPTMLNENASLRAALGGVHGANVDFEFP